MNARLVPLLALSFLVLSACSLQVSPLAAAARAGDLATIDRLLAEGTDPHAGSGVNGWPPLLHALHKGQEKAALRLMTESRPPSRELDDALFMAAGYAQTAMVRALLAHGADPHRAKDGQTALSNAVAGAFDIDYSFKGCGEHAETVRTLLAAAPDLSLAGSAGEAARRAAERRGCNEMLVLLGDGNRNSN